MNLIKKNRSKVKNSNSLKYTAKKKVVIKPFYITYYQDRSAEQAKIGQYVWRFTQVVKRLTKIKPVMFHFYGHKGFNTYQNREHGYNLKKKRSTIVRAITHLSWKTGTRRQGWYNIKYCRPKKLLQVLRPKLTRQLLRPLRNLKHPYKVSCRFLPLGQKKSQYAFKRKKGNYYPLTRKRTFDRRDYQLRQLPPLVRQKTGKYMIVIKRGDRKILRPLKLNDLLPKNSWWKTKKGQRKFRKIRCNSIRYSSRFMTRTRTKFDYLVRRVSKIYSFNRRLSNYLRWVFIDNRFKLIDTSLAKFYVFHFRHLKTGQFIGFRTHQPIRWGQMFSKKQFFVDQARLQLLSAESRENRFHGQMILANNHLAIGFINDTVCSSFNRFYSPIGWNRKYLGLSGRNFKQLLVSSRNMPVIFKNTFTGNIKSNIRLRSYLAIRYTQLR